MREYREKDTLKAHLKFAHAIQANYCIILGEEEFEKKIAIIKNMQTGKQEEITLRRLPQYIMKLCLV